mmetsp:Transcript_15952/g.41110  ORF Transcript_15952/g.41110 Transcript_15952/m.41110 type:complete len:249 (-) Transcript_15952:77-823(-)
MRRHSARSSTVSHTTLTRSRPRTPTLTGCHARNRSSPTNSSCSYRSGRRSLTKIRTSTSLSTLATSHMATTRHGHGRSWVTSMRMASSRTRARSSPKAKSPTPRRWPTTIRSRTRSRRSERSTASRRRTRRSAPTMQPSRIRDPCRRRSSGCAFTRRMTTTRRWRSRPKRMLAKSTRLWRRRRRVTTRTTTHRRCGHAVERAHCLCAKTGAAAPCLRTSWTISVHVHESQPRVCSCATARPRVRGCPN